MIAVIGAVLLAGGGIGIAAMLALDASLGDEWRSPIPREEDPARFRRELSFYGALAVAGAIVFVLGMGDA
jgi:hypothetical protein